MWEFDAPSATYAVVCSALTFIFTLLAVVAHFIPVTAVLFVGTKIEGILCLVLLVLWTAIVSIITEAALGLNAPEDPTNSVQNANLYYFSWAGFFTSVAIVIDYFRAAHGINARDALRNRAPRLELWSGMIGTATVVMGSSSRTVGNDCNYDDYGEFSVQYCARARFGVAIGVLSLLTSIAIVYLKFKGLGSLSIESASALFLTIFNTAGVAYITAAAGPGSAVGNLYYFSWGSCLLSAFISFHCFGEWSGHNPSVEADPTASSDEVTSEQPIDKPSRGGDIVVESLDESV